MRKISAGAKIALPIRFVVNTHYHIDHVNGNDVFAGAGATIVAHRNVRAWMWKNHFPNLIDATTESWVRTLAALQSEHGSSTFVPGHGEVATAGDVSTFRQYLVDLRVAVSRAHADGKSGSALVEAVLPGIRSRHGDWAFFDDYARDDILQTAEELSGHKRVPVPVSAASPR